MQISSKIVLLLCLGDTLSAWGALTNFPCKFGPQFFLRPGGARRAPSVPPGYAYAINYRVGQLK